MPALPGCFGGGTSSIPHASGVTAGSKVERANRPVTADFRCFTAVPQGCGQTIVG